MFNNRIIGFFKCEIVVFVLKCAENLDKVLELACRLDEMSTY